MNQSDQPSQLSRRGLLAGIASLALTLPAARALGALVKPAPKFDPKFELLLEVEIATLEGFRVHRPYVAAWIEDASGKSVRTLSLWVQTERRGPKWIPDLRRWFRGEEARRQADQGDLIQTVSSATRGAGKYSLVWDGKNDKGSLVDQGDYTVCIEATREHGTYQLMTLPFKAGTKTFKKELEGNVEIKGATVEFRRRKA